ncbi:MAG: DUF4149 domain-containing protein [Acidobacteriota bacterium]|nr:DUF4149 domain-containing protein [Acidobacteriota bacterium]
MPNKSNEFSLVRSPPPNSTFALSIKKLHNKILVLSVMRILSDFRLLLLGVWIGAACFLSFAVAPSAFAVLPSREAAGAMVNQTLAILNYSGIVISLILLASSYLPKNDFSRAWLWIERILLLLTAAACAFGQFFVGWKLQNLRAEIGRPLEELAAEDPLRIAFNNLHGQSVTVLSVAMIAALIAFFLIARRARNYEKNQLKTNVEFH